MKKTNKPRFDFHTAPRNQRVVRGGLLGLALASTLPSLVPYKHPATAPLQTPLRAAWSKDWHPIPALRLSFADAAPAPASALRFQPRLAISFDEPAPHRLSGRHPDPDTTGVVFVNEKSAVFEPHEFKAPIALHKHTKRGRLLAALQEQPSFLRLMKAGTTTGPDATSTEDTALHLADAIAALETPAVLPYADDKRQTGSLKSALTDSENRRAATLGIARDAMRFDDRPGRLSSAAGAGVWNGQPAAALGLGYTLPSGWARVNATGVSSGQKTFGVTAVASIAFN